LNCGIEGEREQYFVDLIAAPSERSTKCWL